MGRTQNRISRAARIADAALSVALLFGVLGVGALAWDAAPQAARSAWAQTRPASDSAAARKERILFYERSFRPSTYDAPLQALPAAERDTTAGGRMMSIRDTYAAPETVQGFRIQVMNTNSYDESIATRNALLAAIDTWWVYVIFDSPTYKVRIGDFATRLEAKSVLEQVQMKGFPNAWLVPDKVVLHLPARMPLAAPLTDSSFIGK